MFLNGKTVDEIGEDDLLSLIGKEENHTLDFKRSVYSPKDRDEFLADISSFANAAGGYIILGMDEDDLKAKELCGLGAIQADTELQRLQNWANEGVEPRIPGLRFKVVDLQDRAKAGAIVIYIPRSYAMPHQVKPTRRFHSRYSVGKDGMNVHELRAAFNLSESLVDRIKGFRAERVNILRADEHDEIPVILQPGPRLVLHVVPFASADYGAALDLSPLMVPPTTVNWVSIMDHKLRDLGIMSDNRWPNFEGIVTASNPVSDTGQRLSYMQVFRNGAIEIVYILRDHFVPLPQGSEPKEISLKGIEYHALIGLNCALYCQHHLGIEPPLVVMLSLINIRERKFGIETEYGPHWYSDEVRRDQLLIPDTVCIDYATEDVVIMKPIFDILWNTAGQTRSESYDKKGNWHNPHYPKELLPRG